MSKGRLASILQIFRKTKDVYKQPQVLIAVDKAGNKFYEKYDDPAKGLKGSRWVEPPDGDLWTVPKVSSEWNAWLRGRRSEPPSAEELEKNEMIMLQRKARAEMLEKSREEEHKAMDEAKGPGAGDKRTPFPKYEDYELGPGEHANKKNL